MSAMTYVMDGTISWLINHMASRQDRNPSRGDAGTLAHMGPRPPLSGHTRRGGRVCAALHTHRRVHMLTGFSQTHIWHAIDPHGKTHIGTEMGPGSEHEHCTGWACRPPVVLLVHAWGLVDVP